MLAICSICAADGAADLENCVGMVHSPQHGWSRHLGSVKNSLPENRQRRFMSLVVKLEDDLGERSEWVMLHGVISRP